MTKELARVYKSFDGPVKDVNGRLIIHDDDQMKRWKGHLKKFLIASYPVRLWIKLPVTVTSGYELFLQERTEIISAISTLITE